ncbi:hypothetical protein FP026_25755 [Rhizobium tropici]|uniref:SnoaL-like domain-containing protein n=1 Tax=Rhizobium tropici TaxID=398 RepID=A0A5B0VSU8_RHITR|nr:nuclear transport factor 2 family protein [Rhizobium tropici]KAA1176971.1 hypothetical protein FP026_25755 [Rhizobium tropici]
MTQSTATVAAQVTAVLDEYASAWTARDLQRIADRWDEADAGLSYIAEELGVILLDRASITDHLLRTEYRVTASRVRLRDIHVRELADGLALATFICRWDLDWTSYSRVTTIFRWCAGTWRFIHYMEAPFHTEDWPDDNEGIDC